MKGLQRHPGRPDHVMVNLYPSGCMYLNPADLKEITSATKKYTEVRYGQQRLRLAEREDKVRSLLDTARG